MDDEWMREEYVTLRSEIADKIKLQNDLLMFAFTTSTGILAWLASQGSSVWWGYLLPQFCVEHSD